IPAPVGKGIRICDVPRLGGGTIRITVYENNLSKQSTKHQCAGRARATWPTSTTAMRSASGPAPLIWMLFMCGPSGRGDGTFYIGNRMPAQILGYLSNQDG